MQCWPCFYSNEKTISRNLNLNSFNILDCMQTHSKSFRLLFQNRRKRKNTHTHPTLPVFLQSHYSFNYSISYSNILATNSKLYNMICWNEMRIIRKERCEKWNNVVVSILLSRIRLNKTVYNIIGCSSMDFPKFGCRVFPRTSIQIYGVFFSVVNPKLGHSLNCIRL